MEHDSGIREDLRENNRVIHSLTEKMSAATTLLGEQIRQNDRRDAEYRDLFKRLADHDDEQRSTLADLKSQVAGIAKDQAEIKDDQTAMQDKVSEMSRRVDDAKLIFNFSKKSVVMLIGFGGTAVAAISWCVNHVHTILELIK